MVGDDFEDNVARLEKSLARDRGLVGRLEAIAGIARRMVPDCDAAGVAVIAKGRVWSVATSDGVALEIDLVQYDTGEGPCLQAIRDRHVVRVDLLDAAEDYPHFAPGALDAGINSVLSVPARWEGTIVGTLNMYSKATNGFRDDGAIRIAQELASYAAESIVTSPLYAYSVQVVEDLVESLATDEVVGRAITIICETAGCDESQAMADLRESARLRDESLRLAAEWVIREQRFSNAPPDAANEDQS
jgi:GAF domain-containing protein